jgi:hypothetical protein
LNYLKDKELVTKKELNKNDPKIKLMEKRRKMRERMEAKR